MKNFSRSVPGKVIAFVLCIVMQVVAVGCLAAGVLMWEGNFHNHTQQEVIDDAVEGHLRGSAYDAAERYIMLSEDDSVIGVPDDGNIILQVTGMDGTEMMTSESADNVTDWQYSYVFARTEYEWGYETFYWCDLEDYDEAAAAAFAADQEETVREMAEYDREAAADMAGEIEDYSGEIPTQAIEETQADASGNVSAIEETFADTSSDAPAAGRTTFCIVNIALKDGLPEQDEIAMIVFVISSLYSVRRAVLPIGIAAAVIALICYISLMATAAHRPRTEELFGSPFEKFPLDLAFIIYVIAAAIVFGLIADGLGGPDWLLVIVVSAALIVFDCVLLGLLIELAARAKRHTLLSTGMFYNLFRVIGKGLRKAGAGLADFGHHLPLIRKTVLIIIGVTVLEAVMFGVFVIGAWEPECFLVFAVIEKIIVIPIVITAVISMRKLQKGGQALAAGDLAYHTDTSRMLWDLKEHGENLNNIAGGMAIAVEERMKSERMKTELITNVSHDIKTPLTSVINYATLIGEETAECGRAAEAAELAGDAADGMVSCDRERREKLAEYSEVLVRQSDRLKRLLEDLVEASKAQSGTLDVNLMPCDAGVFLTQADGEYEEKMRAAALSLVVKQPDHPVMIMADGRRMWRIFDNLMNNVCKYAQPDTRVYLSLEEQAGANGAEAVIILKNTSRDPLDMTEEELMERFVRGDEARSTDGNGLGLSIAKSLAELQGGSLHLEIDGDLFKAVLRFPAI
ncbi:MAG: sensor histidine kinase [Lachnospiraceae bacterium]|nr:sensor histidine kinase [Lachnospiraceae bacterium]